MRRRGLLARLALSAAAVIHPAVAADAPASPPSTGHWRHRTAEQYTRPAAP